MSYGEAAGRRERLESGDYWMKKATQSGGDCKRGQLQAGVQAVLCCLGASISQVLPVRSELSLIFQQLAATQALPVCICASSGAKAELWQWPGCAVWRGEFIAFGRASHVSA